MNDTILLVEDNEDDVFAFKWALKKSEMSRPIRVVRDGQQAINYLSGVDAFSDRSENPIPCIMFLDLKLPYYSGHEVLEWMRADPAFGGVKVIILSGSDEGRDHARASANGATGYLLKPPEPSELARLIAECEAQPTVPQ